MGADGVFFLRNVRIDPSKATSHRSVSSYATPEHCFLQEEVYAENCLVFTLECTGAALKDDSYCKKPDMHHQMGLARGNI